MHMKAELLRQAHRLAIAGLKDSCFAHGFPSRYKYIRCVYTLQAARKDCGFELRATGIPTSYPGSPAFSLNMFTTSSGSGWLFASLGKAARCETLDNEWLL